MPAGPARYEFADGSDAGAGRPTGASSYARSPPPTAIASRSAGATWSTGWTTSGRRVRPLGLERGADRRGPAEPTGPAAAAAEADRRRPGRPSSTIRRSAAIAAGQRLPAGLASPSRPPPGRRSRCRWNAASAAGPISGTATPIPADRTGRTSTLIDALADRLATRRVEVQLGRRLTCRSVATATRLVGPRRRRDRGPAGRRDLRRRSVAAGRPGAAAGPAPDRAADCAGSTRRSAPTVTHRLARRPPDHQGDRDRHAHRRRRARPSRSPRPVAGRHRARACTTSAPAGPTRRRARPGRASAAGSGDRRSAPSVPGLLARRSVLRRPARALRRRCWRVPWPRTPRTTAASSACPGARRDRDRRHS